MRVLLVGAAGFIGHHLLHALRSRGHEVVILSVTQPELWLHPFGPLAKNVPLVGATLAMMALEE